MSGSILPDPVARQPWRVILPLTALTIFGSAVLYSAAQGSLWPWAVIHTVHYAVFLVMALIMARFPREWFKFAAYPVYAAVLIMLLFVEALGKIGGGSQRWLDLGFMTLQPSELMKPAIVLVLARFFDALPPSLTVSWRGLVPAAALLAVPAFFVIIQPDLGTALAICFGGVVVIFLAGLPLRWFIGAGLATAVAAPIAYFAMLHDYQRRRVTIFLDPESDPLGSGYHITQSKIAIGSGGFFGKGFGNGTQSHLDYLPEGHTDFVFATMAEEWGIVGGFFVLFLYFLLMRWGMNVALQSRTRYGQLVAAGLTCTIFFYIMVNLLMVVGLAPVAGLPLPFISHGGSSMLTMMICVGIIMSIERHPGPTRGQFN